jgi:hypothetical protein
VTLSMVLMVYGAIVSYIDFLSIACLFFVVSGM